ncbi:MAG TPA: DUF2950 domain-containing protein [Opitutaceae bacterium]|jgi:hypothetical protein
MKGPCSHRPRLAGLLPALLLILAPGLARADEAGPREFTTPQEAAQALAAAAKAGDRAGMEAIFGPGIRELRSGDEKQDAIEFGAFRKSIGHFWRLVRRGNDTYVVDVGDQDWPLPIPIVRKDGRWAFDTAAGKDEIINRRVGEDELTAIGVCRTYVLAQREYAAEDHDGSGIVHYARRIKSTQGTRDGLYWPASAGDEQSPLGPLVAQARAEGYTGKTAEGEPQPFHGYRFKILDAQGQAAPGGAYGYVINGNMVAGFALVAYPAHWGESGVMTFIVNQSGRVYQRNLGGDSAAIASAMTEFNPDSDWKLVEAP